MSYIDAMARVVQHMAMTGVSAAALVRTALGRVDVILAAIEMQWTMPAAATHGNWTPPPSRRAAGRYGRRATPRWRLKMGMVGTVAARGRVLLVGTAAGLVNPLQTKGSRPR